MWVKSEWGQCEQNCSGNGICNNNQNCHCDDGFGGEACEKKGWGGSLDSNNAQ